jgi:hypothetical protein
VGPRAYQDVWLRNEPTTSHKLKYGFESLCSSVSLENTIMFVGVTFLQNKKKHTQNV